MRLTTLYILLTIFTMASAPSIAQPLERRTWADADTSLVLTGHTHPVSHSAFTSDGSVLVTASDDDIFVWNTATWKSRSLTFYADRLRGLSLHPDNRHFVVGDLRNGAKVGDMIADTFTLFLPYPKATTIDATFSPDGTRLLTTGVDTAYIWDLASHTILRRLVGHSLTIYSGRYNPDGTRIVTTGADLTVRVWDALSGAQLASYPILSRRTSHVASFSPDGRKILVAGDSLVQILDAQSGAILKTLKHPGLIPGASYNRDGSYFITADEDRRARIYNTKTYDLVATLEGHTSYLLSGSFSPDGKTVATTSYDQTVRIWTLNLADVPSDEPAADPGAAWLYPNPASTIANLHLIVPKSGNIELELVDVTGRSVAHLGKLEVERGTHEVAVDLHGIANGYYLCVIRGCGIERSLPVHVQQ